MNNENEFNFSQDNTFKKSYSKKSNCGFGKTVIVPFLSGVIGATLVIGTCFGVPTIKSKLLNGFSLQTITTANTSNDKTTSLINIADYSNTAVSVAEKTLPSVVGITVTYQISSFFGGSSTGEATGSGIIVSEDGYIVTNNHVINSDTSSSFTIAEATGIKVNVYGDQENYEAKIIGTDAYTDLAVLKIEKKDLKPITIGDSNSVKVGEFVMAVGNPLGMDYSVTSGIVSAIDRELESEGSTFTAIQTDAAINSGNSGGALVNAKGELIGINTMKFAGTGIEGIGFAIPISSATTIIDQLIEFQSVKRPYIGILGSSVDSTTAKRYNLPEGIYVEEVEENSPAASAGLQQADIITKIENTKVSTSAYLKYELYKHEVGDKVKFTYVRNEKEYTTTVVLGSSK